MARKTKQVEKIVEPEVKVMDEGTDTEDATDVNNIVEPEVKEEVVEPTPEVIPEPVKEVKTTSGNVLTDSKVSLEDKIKWCLTEAPIAIKQIAARLESYNSTMDPKLPVDEKRMVSKQYEMVNIYRAVLKSNSYNEFKTKFDVLNLFFNYYAKGSMGSRYLSRFDYLWTWSDKELATLLNFSEVVSLLCNNKDRSKKLKQINLEMAMDSVKTIIDEEARNNVIRYYTA